MARKPGKYYIGLAENCPNITVKNGSGDHYKAYGHDKNGDWTMTVIPQNLKGNGTECSIVKWLLRFGIVAIIVIALFIVF